MKKLVLLFLINLFLPYLSFSTESFLREDVAILKDTGKTIISKKLNKSAHLYICTEENFNNLFPKKIANVLDESYFSGQIMTQNRTGVGSGTLFDIQERDGKLIGIGFTAFHVFCSLEKNNGNALKIDNDLYFFLGKKAISEESIDETSSLGLIKINKVLFQKEILSQIKKDILTQKDICLFEGEFIGQGENFVSKDSILEIFNKYRPILIEQEMSEKEYHNKSVKIYHYPAGNIMMRVNEGEVKGKRFHTIRTLNGSSGAAILQTSDKK